MRHIVGSRYFFKQYDDYKSHDIDMLELQDDCDYEKCRIIRGQGRDLFFFKRKPKDELIQDALNSELPMVVGKFLIPEFNKEIGFTIEDLPKIKDLIDILDDKHKYEEIIYNSYIENKSFNLTEEQRLEAYKSYKKSRGV